MCGDVRFSEVVKVLEAIESTSDRSIIVRLLARLLGTCPPDVIDKVIYFLLGELRPSWEGIELRVGEKLTLRALSLASGVPLRKIEELYKKLGDIGEVAKTVLQTKQQTTILHYLDKSP